MLSSDLLPFNTPTAVKAATGTQVAVGGREKVKIADTGRHWKTTGASQPMVDTAMKTGSNVISRSAIKNLGSVTNTSGVRSVEGREECQLWERHTLDANNDFPHPGMPEEA